VTDERSGANACIQQHQNNQQLASLLRVFVSSWPVKRLVALMLLKAITFQVLEGQRG
jgi:hypothetical protein